MSPNHRLIVDTGPVVAFLNRRDRHHEWAERVLGATDPPLVTCEAVISEACFLLRSVFGGPQKVMELVQRGLIDASFHLRDEIGAVQALMMRYQDLPVSFADACLLRMAETHPGYTVMTCDQDFMVYRMLGRRMVPSLMPDRGI